MEAAADAMAQQDMFAIGGYLKLTTGRIWRKLCDLNFTGLELLDTAQSYIASFEALAQIALLHCAAALFPGGRLRAQVKSWCDNTGAESAPRRKTGNGSCARGAQQLRQALSPTSAASCWVFAACCPQNSVFNEVLRSWHKFIGSGASATAVQHNFTCGLGMFEAQE